MNCLTVLKISRLAPTARPSSNWLWEFSDNCIWKQFPKSKLVDLETNGKSSRCPVSARLIGKGGGEPPHYQAQVISHMEILPNSHMPTVRHCPSSFKSLTLFLQIRLYIHRAVAVKQPHTNINKLTIMPPISLQDI